MVSLRDITPIRGATLYALFNRLIERVYKRSKLFSSTAFGHASSLIFIIRCLK